MSTFILKFDAMGKSIKSIANLESKIDKEKQLIDGVEMSKILGGRIKNKNHFNKGLRGRIPQ